MENVDCGFSDPSKFKHCHISACDDKLVHVCNDCIRNLLAWISFINGTGARPTHDYYVDLQKGY